MTKDIVFLLTTLDSHSRCRVNDFISHGFNVKVYAFTRSNESQSTDTGWPVEVVGSFDNSLSYHKRLPILYRGIKKVASDYKKNDEVCFYYLGLDVAMIATSLISHPYIYEECDLTHTRVRNLFLRSLFEKLDRHIICNSLHCVLTSEGFIQYHKLKDLHKITVLANKLPQRILEFSNNRQRKPDCSHLSFGFVGSVRYQNIISFALILVKNYPQHEFHFFGNVQQILQNSIKSLEKYPNCYFHGRFTSPDDLPEIYSKIDFTIATYDTSLENVKYAEPNKIYEAVYFRTPIIVSKHTFLAEKTIREKIGFAVDTSDEKDVVDFIAGITDSFLAKSEHDISSIPVEYAIEDNDDFFRKLKGQL